MADKYKPDERPGSWFNWSFFECISPLFLNKKVAVKIVCKLIEISSILISAEGLRIPYHL